MRLKGARPFNNLLLGITGSIESANSFRIASHIAPICEALTVIFTKEATKYCSTSAVSHIESVCVITDEASGTSINPTILASDADMFVVAPLSANTLAKMAHGIADNTLLSVALAVQCPKVVAPSMSDAMWSNPLVQANVRRLVKAGFSVVQPVIGREVHSLTPQYGAMPKPEMLVDELCRMKRNFNENDASRKLGE